MSEYTKSVQYLFQIRGNEFAVSQDGNSDDGTRQYTVEDTRKNGQEDCHAFDTLYADRGHWAFEGGGKSGMQGGMQGLVADVQHYPLWTIYPDGVAIPGPNIQLGVTVRFLTWRQLADEWEIYGCPPWDFWQPCYLFPAPVEQTALEEIAAQGVGPRRVNLEDAPASPTDNSDVPF